MYFYFYVIHVDSWAILNLKMLVGVYRGKAQGVLRACKAFIYKIVLLKRAKISVVYLKWSFRHVICKFTSKTIVLLRNVVNLQKCIKLVFRFYKFSV